MLLPYDTWGQVLSKNRSMFAKILKHWPSGSNYLREVFYSFLTFLIFSATPLVLNNSYIKPDTLHKEYDSRFDEVSNDTSQLRKQTRQNAVK